MTIPASGLRFKTRILACVVILSNVFGNLLLSLGLRGDFFVNPWIVLGVSLLILWMLARMTLLSWADLTYVLPVTALGYVLTAVVARMFLGEQVSPARWAGIALIIAGVSMVSDTPIRTTAGQSREEAA
jgi:drug/metabolite transporter (DMT)-like permease